MAGLRRYAVGQRTRAPFLTRIFVFAALPPSLTVAMYTSCRAGESASSSIWALGDDHSMLLNVQVNGLRQIVVQLDVTCFRFR